MATTISAGSDTGIAVLNLDHIEVRGTSLIVTWFYTDGTTHSTTGSDATDFIAHLMPFLAKQAPLQYYPLL